MSNSKCTSLETAAEQTGVSIKEISLHVLAGEVQERVTPYTQGGERQINLDELKKIYNK